jgi:uncharacterized protein
MEPRRSVFLSARWSNLALITYPVSPQLLIPFLPSGCELDTLDGDAFVSLVAFDFLQTKVLGIAWPGHVNFPEINLRFYCRFAGQRGVAFIREFVPRRIIAWVARRFYNEPYRAAAMSSRVVRSDGELSMQHVLTLDGKTHSLRLTADPNVVTVARDSREHFFKEHEWGFGQSRDGRLIRYRVEHPTWSIHPVRSFELNWDWAAVYGSPWAFLQNHSPRLVILAAGSPVRVFRGEVMPA